MVVNLLSFILRKEFFFKWDKDSNMLKLFTNIDAERIWFVEIIICW